MQSRQFAKCYLNTGQEGFCSSRACCRFVGWITAGYASTLPQQPVLDIGNIAAQSGASGSATVDQGSK